VTKTQRKLLIAGAILLATPILYLVWEHYSGKWALAAWEKDMRAKGEKLTVDQLRPTFVYSESNGAVSFLAAASVLSSNEVKWPTPTISPSLGYQVLPGKVVGIQPMLEISGVRSNTWKQFEQQVEDQAEVLALLRQAIRKPVLDFGVRYIGLSEPLTHLTPLIKSADWLKAECIYYSRKRELDAALEAIVSLAELGNKLRRERLGISQFYSLNATQSGLLLAWAALQIDGWTEHQLSVLQQGWSSRDAISTALETANMDRLLILKVVEQGISSGLSTTQILPPFQTPNNLDALEWVSNAYNHLKLVFVSYVGGPAWIYAWYDRAKLDYLATTQQVLESKRRARAPNAWKVGSLLIETRASETYGPYDRLRFNDSRSSARAWAIGLENIMHSTSRIEMWREMTVAAIALKRYNLRHGKLPDTLTALVPEFLSIPPVDFMNGQPLCYRPKPDGTYQLYSVGDNGRDDGGNPQRADKMHPISGAFFEFWSQDIVWPSPATTEDIAEYRRQHTQPK
jgi:hypothetical protein